MNVTEEVTIHRPNVSTLLSSAFIRGELEAMGKKKVAIGMKEKNQGENENHRKPPECKNRGAINLIDKRKYISYRMTTFLYLMF